MAGPARLAAPVAKPAGIDELLMPGISPRNIRADGRFRISDVTGDLYMISERIREIDPRLFIIVTEDTKAGRRAYTIMHEVERGREEFVFWCSTLDARVLEHVRYLLKVPFDKRFAEAEKELEKYEADQENDEMEQLVERLGLPMVRDLAECGFLDEFGGRSVNYPFRGRTKRGRGSI